MKLHILGSSSQGNSYILEGENSVLLIECGVKLSKVKEALNFDLSKVVGALVSHSHGDHAGYVKDFVNAGIKVYMSGDTASEIKVKHHNVKVIEKGLASKDFSVIPFELKHDVACLGFMIQHPECGNTVFITDTHYVPYTFKNLNNVIIECNYSDEILEDNILNNRIHPSVRNRVIGSHMSLATCLGVFKANNLSQVQNIVLTHLSDGNSNAALFKAEVERHTAKTVCVADKNMSIDFNKEAF